MKRIALGIYADRYGFRIVWRDRGRTREKRFPTDTPIDRLKDWRRVALKTSLTEAKVDGDGSFPRDVVRFLRRRRGLAGFKSDRAHLRPWVRRFRRYSRWAITREHVEAAIDDWRVDGYSPRELRHRLRMLRQVFWFHDGRHTRTPCDDVRLPSIPKPRPISVADTVVRDVALQLWKHEQDGIGRLRSAKTRARYLVLATTGQRPAQMMRAHPIDVDLGRRMWFVRPAKGDNGSIVYLNDDMFAAWKLFIAVKAWGKYDQRSFVKTLQRNGWPRGVRPYVLRHMVGMSLSELGVDLGDIQAHMGHASMDTTRRFYVPAILSRLKDASEKLNERRLVSLPSGTAIFSLVPDATTREKTPHSAGRPNTAKAALHAVESKKTG